MIHIATKCLHTIEQDYWRLSLQADLADDRPHCLHIEGRRRTTELFWPAYQFPIEEMERLLTSVNNAALLVEGYHWTAPLTHLATVPNSETMAICCGPFYTLELAESMNGNLAATISMTLLDKETPARPVLYLIDDELSSFLSDLREIEQILCQFSANRTLLETEYDDPLFLEFVSNNYGCC